MLAAVAGGLYYVFLGTGQSVNEVNTNDAKRVASQPAQQQPAGLSRTEYDRQRAGQYGSAVQDSPSLTASQKHNEETQRLMQQVSNSSQP